MNCPPTRLEELVTVLRSAGLLIEVRGSEDAVFGGVCQDSRLVGAGDLFLSWAGSTVDGHDFVLPAERAGAVAAVVERPVGGVGIPQLVVEDGRKAAAIVAQVAAGRPTEGMFLGAVTGTNGKTTTAWIARHLLDGTVGPAAALGTVGVVAPGGVVDEETVGLTSPGPVELAERLRDLRETGVGAVVLEASSHALDQRRLDGIRFDAAVFTNISRDHLDYHGTFEAYRAAKVRLASLLDDGGCAVVNAGESAWDGVATRAPRVLTFGLELSADYRADDIRGTASETRFRLRAEGAEHDVLIPLPGRYNVANALGALGVGRAAGVPLAALIERLRTVPQVPGRLEVVVRDPFTVIIDFAHTPAALEGVLRALRPTTAGRLIVVFGAGGDRDRTKRGEMGAVVAALADLPVVTSDNPRTEDPGAIVDEIELGMGGAEHLRIVDRREAIHTAVRGARPGDLVLLAGKGHERYQVVGDRKLPFDERAIVMEALGEAA